MAMAKIQTQGFKTAVHKPMDEATDATSSIYTVYDINPTSPACVSSAHKEQESWRLGGSGAKVIIALACDGWNEAGLYRGNQFDWKFEMKEMESEQVAGWKMEWFT